MYSPLVEISPSHGYGMSIPPRIILLLLKLVYFGTDSIGLLMPVVFIWCPLFETPACLSQRALTRRRIPV